MQRIRLTSLAFASLLSILAVNTTSALPSTEWTKHKSADGTHPDGREQMMLWLMNRARSNPAVEGTRLAAIADPDIQDLMNFFEVDRAKLESDFSALPPRPPAAFDAALFAASQAHAQDLIERNRSDSDGQLTRIDEAGYHRWSVRASVFAFVENALHAHAALNIDWGLEIPEVEPDGVVGGMQDPPEHRYAIMGVPVDGTTSELSTVGIALLEAPVENPVPPLAGYPDVGPLVFSAVYCHGDEGEQNRFVVGTVWEDTNENGRYDPDEGLADVEVMPDAGTYYAVTGHAGGYAIPIEAPGSYSISFSGEGLESARRHRVEVGETSVLLDPLQVPEPHLALLELTALSTVSSLTLARRRPRRVRDTFSARRSSSA